MSEYTFKLPDLGEGLVEAEIAEWMVKPGDSVEEEDVICAVMTDKAAVELTAPVKGKVLSTSGEPGDMVAVGSALIVFETSADTSNLSESEASPATDTATPVKEDSPEKKPPVRKAIGTNGFCTPKYAIIASKTKSIANTIPTTLYCRFR